MATEAVQTEVLSASEPVAVEAAFEPEPYEGLSIVEVDELEAIDLESIETPLADDDEAALEAGIASVFDTILAEGFDDSMFEAANDESDDFIAGETAYYDEAPDEDDGDDVEPTFALLAELNRIWAQPLAA